MYASARCRLIMPFSFRAASGFFAVFSSRYCRARVKGVPFLLWKKTSRYNPMPRS